MVNIKINDVPISVEEGTTILEACREAKMIVPTPVSYTHLGLEESVWSFILQIKTETG